MTVTVCVSVYHLGPGRQGLKAKRVNQPHKDPSHKIKVNEV